MFVSFLSGVCQFSVGVWCTGSCVGKKMQYCIYLLCSSLLAWFLGVLFNFLLECYHIVTAGVRVILDKQVVLPEWSNNRGEYVPRRGGIFNICVI